MLGVISNHQYHREVAQYTAGVGRIYKLIAQLLVMPLIQVQGIGPQFVVVFESVGKLIDVTQHIRLPLAGVI